MTFSWLILIVNAMTLAVTIAAAVKRPIWSYRLIAGVAGCVLIAALHQVITGRDDWFVSPLIALLVLLITGRVFLNLLSARQRGKH